MYDLTPRRRISLILVKLGPAHCLNIDVPPSGIGPPVPHFLLVRYRQASQG